MNLSLLFFIFGLLSWYHDEIYEFLDPLFCISSLSSLELEFCLFTLDCLKKNDLLILGDRNSC